MEIDVKPIKASAGNVFCNPEKTEVYSSEMYLAKDAKQSDFIEITIQEAEKIINELKNK